MNTLSIKELNRISKTGSSELDVNKSYEYLEKLNLSDLKYAIFLLSNETRNSFNKVQAIKEIVSILKNDKKISIFFHRLTIPEKSILYELTFRTQISFLDALEILVKQNAFSTLSIFKLVNVGILEKIDENSTLPNLNFNFKLKLSPLINHKIIPNISKRISTFSKEEIPFGECLPIKNALSNFILKKHSLANSSEVETFYKRIFENLTSESLIKDFSNLVSNNFKEVHKDCYNSWIKTFIPIYFPFYHPKDFENWSKLILNAVRNIFNERQELFLEEISQKTEGFLIHFSDAFTLNNNFRFNSKRISFLTKIIVEDFVKLGFVSINSKNQKFSITNELLGNYSSDTNKSYNFIRESIVKFDELKSFKTIFVSNLFGDLFKENTFKLNPKKILSLTENGISLSQIEILLKDVFFDIPEIFRVEINRLSKRKDSVRLATNLLIYEIEERELWKEIKAKGFRCAKGKFVFVTKEEAKNFEMKYLRNYQVIETKDFKPLHLNENKIKLDNSKSDLRLESILEKLTFETKTPNEFEFTKSSIERGKDLGIKIDDVNYLFSKVAFGTINKEFKRLILSE
ncbi:MAG: hypothetical protein DWQ06_11210 [Calditrichaeota bacterium]|nr:MAG: hypothetical protein DWQ06_11210 [Calditrichota bacterium]